MEHGTDEKMLVSTMLAPGFSYENNIIGIEEASHPLHYAISAGYGSLLLYNAERLCSRFASKAPLLSTSWFPNLAGMGF